MLMTSIFVCRPVVLESYGPKTIEDADPQIDFWWLVPVHDDEAHYARSQGFEALEFALSNSYLQLWDLKRPSIFSTEAKRIKQQNG
jgi:hypothetical protein